MSNIPVLGPAFPPNPHHPAPPKTYATYNNTLEHLRYQHTVLCNLALDYWHDGQRERATIRAITAALLERGYILAQRRLVHGAPMTPQIPALMGQLLVCQLGVRRAMRGWREARRILLPVELQMEWEQGEEEAEGVRQAFARGGGGEDFGGEEEEEGEGEGGGGGGGAGGEVEEEAQGQGQGSKGKGKEVQVEEVQRQRRKSKGKAVAVEAEEVEVAERRRRKGKGKEVVREVEEVEEVEVQRPAKRGRVGEASSSKN